MTSGGVPSPPRRVKETPLVAVLALAALGLLVIYLDHFRAGSLLIALALLVAAGLRLTLPARRAGLLVVRSRPLDVFILSVLGLAVAALAIAVPEHRP